MKNEKNIFKFIGVFFLGVFASLWGVLSRRRNRPASESVGNQIEPARKSLESARSENTESSRTVGEIQNTNDELRRNIEECRKILEEIRSLRKSE